MSYIKTRKSAIEWWNAQPLEYKQILCNTYYIGRKPDSLTGREIEYIYKQKI